MVRMLVGAQSTSSSQALAGYVPVMLLVVWCLSDVARLPITAWERHDHDAIDELLDRQRDLGLATGFDELLAICG